MKHLKHLSKRGLALFLSLVMAAGMMNLTVFAAETPEHSHNQDGWACEWTEGTKTLICEEAEHTHESVCYAEERTLTCGEQEAEAGHIHDADCYSDVPTENLACEEEHEHGEDCYATQRVLTCEQEEVRGHAHGDECYHSTLSCEVNEHAHGDACYTVTEGTWTCTAPATGSELPSEVVQFRALLDQMEAFVLTEENQAEYQALGDQAGALFDVLLEDFYGYAGMEDDMVRFQALADKQTGGAEMMAEMVENEDYTIDAAVEKTVFYSQTGGTHTLTVNGTMHGTVTVTGGTLTITGTGTGTIDATGYPGSVILVKGTEASQAHVILNGSVTITGGTGTPAKDLADTGGKWTAPGHTLGGGVCVTGRGSSFTMNGGTITGNTATAGGGIYVDTVLKQNENGTWVACVLYEAICASLSHRSLDSCCSNSKILGPSGFYFRWPWKA